MKSHMRSGMKGFERDLGQGVSGVGDEVRPCHYSN
jgi:hypothetical protein